MKALQFDSTPLPAHQEHSHRSVALQHHVSTLTTRLETLNRRRQAAEYRRLADERSWLIARLLPHVRDLEITLSLLAVMRGDALAYGREVVRTMVLTNPFRYDVSVRLLSVPALLLLASVLESANADGPEAVEFIQQVQQMAFIAHQQLVG